MEPNPIKQLRDHHASLLEMPEPGAKNPVRDAIARSLTETDRALGQAPSSDVRKSLCCARGFLRRAAALQEVRI